MKGNMRKSLSSHRLRALALGSLIAGAPPLIAAPPVNPIDCSVLRMYEKSPNFARPGLNFHSREFEQVFIMSGHEQAKLPRPEALEEIKSDMLNETFDYNLVEARVGGFYHNRTGTFFVTDGHHRLAAALEVAVETGDYKPFKKLMALGLWERSDSLPKTHYRLPMRSSWTKFLAYRALINRMTPPESRLNN